MAVADHRPDRWAAHLPVTQLRFARTTSRLEAVVHSYRDCLGIDELSRFEDHAGYDGVMLGLPDAWYSLELTQRTGIEGSASTTENLPGARPQNRVGARPGRGALHQQRVPARPSREPVPGRTDAVTFEAPDG